MDLNELKAMRLQARKNSNTVRYSILTLLVGEYETRLKGPDAKDASVEAIARKLIKSNTETLAVRDDKKLRAENAILEEFLPKQLTETQLTAIINKLAANDGANIGSIMKVLNQKYAGQFDRSLAAKLVKSVI